LRKYTFKVNIQKRMKGRGKEKEIRENEGRM
jgi:hypothetical protein